MSEEQYYYTIFAKRGSEGRYIKDVQLNRAIREDGELPESLGELMKRISQFDSDTYLKDDYEYKPKKIEKMDE